MAELVRKIIVFLKEDMFRIQQGQQEVKTPTLKITFGESVKRPSAEKRHYGPRPSAMWNVYVRTEKCTKSYIKRLIENNF